MPTEPAETYCNHSVVCPYCGYEHGDADELFGHREDTEIECDGCGKTFVATRVVSVSYHASPLREKRA
jgi:hypothetical protein